MKRLFSLPLLLCFAVPAFCQNDTLLFENFDTDPTGNYAQFNSGNDLTWVNFDADGIPDYNGRPQDWFYSTGGFASVDSIDACLFSSSWLQNFQTGNRNWLITPPLQIVDASAVLSWATAPRQTPRYLDGYSVLVSTTDNLEASFTDTLFQAAQYLTGTGNDWSTYTFSPGFVHGLDSTYIEYDGDSSRFVGIFRPFSASLSAYSGQSIYIAFLHDADDDNLISIDDILVTGTLVGINEPAAQEGMRLSPNPARDHVELSYTLPATAPVVVEVFDVQGCRVAMMNRGIQLRGFQKLTIPVSGLPSGSYLVSVHSGRFAAQSRFIRE